MPNRHRYLLVSILLDVLFLGLGFLLFTWIFPGTKHVLIPKLWLPFVGLTVLWLIVSLISRKFIDPHLKTLLQLFSGLLTSGLTMFVITLVWVIVTGVNKKVTFIALGTGFFAFALECLWVLWINSRIKYTREKGKTAWFRPILYPELLHETGQEVDEDQPRGNKLLPEGGDFLNPFRKLSDREDSISGILKGKYLENNPDLFNFLENTLPLDTIHKSKSQIINTHTLFNLRNVEEGTQQLIVNFQRLNDIRKINELLIQVNLNLAPGGWFLCCARVQEVRKEWILNQFSFPVNRIIYMGDFLINRVMPKLPFFRVIYFRITKGENRVMSQTEILGRLYYCGFEKIAQVDINANRYFLAQKIRSHNEDTNPSYGPFIKMKRVGLHGRMISIYKVRTMHPYSEYVQDYLYKCNSLDDTGKFRDDFRITSWGHIFRKLWFDELPQLLNLYRGQVKIVGVRALSQHYFSLYPKELQELRIKTKPGLIPPFYADRPKSFDEICASEFRYLESYLRHPLKTDWHYFWKAMYNIFILRARSS